MNAQTIAAQNFEAHLQHNPYPGRGLVIGRSSVDDAWVIIYWIMGRSANSRNRLFTAQNGILKTEPVDMALVDDPTLIIYEAMLELPSLYLVSNGDQTRTIYDTLQAGGDFQTALEGREREPDAPHYTPRISGMLDLRQSPGSITLSILKASTIDPAYTDRFTYRPSAAAAGFGFGLTTYQGEGNPLPGFSGDPLLLPCTGDAETLLNTYWDALNPDNRISLAVKHIAPHDGSSQLLVRNRFSSTQ